MLNSQYPFDMRFLKQWVLNEHPPAWEIPEFLWKRGGLVPCGLSLGSLPSSHHPGPHLILHPVHQLQVFPRRPRKAAVCWARGHIWNSSSSLN